MEEARVNTPLVGGKFPEMEVRTTQGMMKLPKDMKGKWFVLFSHPADFTPVCTTDFVEFQKRKGEFDALGCKIIGMSVDQVFSHIKWLEWIKEKLGVEIEFPVIAATEGIAATLGMTHGATGGYTIRAVYIVDAKGVVRLMMYYPPELGRNVDEILRAVKALQIADKEDVGIPANWPESELLGDRLIVPPAATIEEAEKRKGMEGYDWWFCHRAMK